MKVQFAAVGSTHGLGTFLLQGEGQLEKVDLRACYITAVLQSLTHRRQLLKYLPLSDERFCGVSQRSV